MDAGKDRHDAVVEAVTTAGRSVILAGSTVVIAVLGLVPDRPAVHVRRRDRGLARGAGRDARRGHAAAGAARPTSARTSTACGSPASAARTKARGRTRSRPRRAGATPCSAGRGPRRSPPTAVLLALAAPALGMRLGFPDAGNDPPSTMTRQAYDLNTQGFGPGHERAAGDRRRAAQRGRQAADRRARRAAARASRASPSSRRRAINAQGDAAMLTVIPTGSPQDAETSDLVHRLRDDVVPRGAGAAPASPPRSAA